MRMLISKWILRSVSKNIYVLDVINKIVILLDKCNNCVRVIIPNNVLILKFPTIIRNSYYFILSNNSIVYIIKNNVIKNIFYIDY